MGKKYKVEQEGQFLGHHHGNSPEDAVKKAVCTYGVFYNIDQEKTFNVTYGSNKTEVTLGKE